MVEKGGFSYVIGWFQNVIGKTRPYNVATRRRLTGNFTKTW